MSRPDKGKPGRHTPRLKRRPDPNVESQFGRDGKAGLNEPYFVEPGEDLILVDNATVASMASVNKAAGETTPMVRLTIEGRLNKTTKRRKVTFVLDAAAVPDIANNMLEAVGRAQEDVDAAIKHAQKYPEKFAVAYPCSDGLIHEFEARATDDGGASMLSVPTCGKPVGIEMNLEPDPDDYPPCQECFR